MARSRLRISKKEKRKIAEYYVENNSTIRKTAEFFGLSKTYVHVALTEFQEDRDTKDSVLAIRVKELIEKNTLERAVRGGLAVSGNRINRKSKN